MLAVYGALSAYVFGFLLNMWFWPYTIGTFTGAGADPGLQFVPGDAVISNLHRFFGFTAARHRPSAGTPVEQSPTSSRSARLAPPCWRPSAAGDGGSRFSR